MKSCILVRYDEIGLRGKNRPMFERILNENIRQAYLADALHPGPVEKRMGRLIVHSGNGKPLKQVFGISSYSVAFETEPDIKAMADAAMRLCELHPNVSFRVSCQRLDKTMSLTSRDVDRLLGAELVERTNAEVDLTEFDWEIGVELISGKSYVFVDRIRCFAGLPVGSEGTVLALIDNEASVLAALLMLRRGCAVVPVSFSDKQHSILAKFNSRAQRLLKNEGDVDIIAKEVGAKALVVGQLLHEVRDIETFLLVLRPLVGCDERHVKVKLNEFMSDSAN